MRLTVLGSSPVRPNPGSACSGYIVEAQGTRVLVDCGPGVVARLLEVDGAAETLDAVLISHAHPDHILDLVALRYGLVYGPATRRQKPLPLLVGPGVDTALITLGGIFGGSDFWEPLDVATYDPTEMLEVKDLSVTFAPTVHYIDCWAMRFESADGIIVFTADTGPCESVEELASDADLLLAEATLPQREGNESDWGHMSGREAGEMASRGEVGRLLLTHFWSEVDTDGIRQDAASAFDGVVELARDGMTYGLD